MSLAPALTRIVGQMTAKFGTRITMRKTAVGVFQSGNDSVPLTSIDWPDVPAAEEMINYSSPNGDVQIGDRRYLIPANAVSETPDATWAVVVDDRVWPIVGNVGIVRINGTAVVYSFTVRGGPRGV